MGIRIDGKAVSAAFREKLKEDVARLTEQGMQPGLAVVIVGDDQASRVYVNNKKKAWPAAGNLFRGIRPLRGDYGRRAAGAGKPSQQPQPDPRHSGTAALAPAYPGEGGAGGD